MKAPQLWLAAAGIAAISGTGGWFLGRNTAPVAELRGESMSGTTRANRSASSSAPGVPRLNAADIGALKARLAGETDPIRRFKLAMSRMEAWMNADPPGALEWITGQEASSRRNEALRMATGQFAENDPKGAAEWSLAHFSGIELNNLLIRIAEQWAREDGLAAASWFSALPATGERDAALETLLFRWSGEDPRAAIAWLEANPGDPGLDAILRYAAYAGWAKADPRGAVAASLESSRRFDDPAQFASTIANWATVDLTESSAWLLDNVRDARERAPAVSEMAAIFAHQSPQAGLAWIGKLPAAEQPAALNRLTAEWASSDPASAAQWLGSANPAGIDPESVAAVLHGFLAADAPGFLKWQAALPPGPLRERTAELTADAPEE